MVDFLISFQKTMLYEGGYSNDLNDLGGETYRGVSRKNNSTWSGWNIIDSYKNKPNFPKSLDTDNSLQDSVKQFYKINYWDKFSGDQISNQDIVNFLFDCSVNLGLFRTIMFLQKSLNILTTDFLVEDGSFGSKTLTSLLNYLNKDKSIYLMKLLTTFRGFHYINIVLSNSSQKKFIKGWLNRL